ncbi:MAG: hypothetical protein VZQ83_08480 [Eubacterium sp.]|nr:hypothetical protein [Eubacterium sp.]
MIESILLDISLMYTERIKEVVAMSEKWTLNVMSLALVVGIILTWITWEPQVVIITMVLSVLRLGSLFYEYPELTGHRD